ncbi:MAG: serine/threonine-protein kinase [Candidatus Melainabacteria bacterium]|nr:serine/threonine-protein kinase [Candidatus Melainabacteria bacterium]
MSNNSVNGFKVDQIVFQKYRILNFIAEGGGGRVYRAQDTFRQIDVAIKVLLVDQTDQKSLVRFQSEARTASKLSHANIATIFDFGLWEGNPYLIMQYVDGESLHDVLKTEHTLDLATFYEIFSQVADAISHAHKSQIVHRDLKPANIIIAASDDGRMKPTILDFGIAKSLDATTSAGSGSLTMTGAVIGSPLYMSPEQADGQEVTLASDLYSLGAIMFRCLAGVPPIQGNSLMETIMMVRTETPASIAEMVEPGALPQRLCDLIDGLLSKTASQRPSLQKVVIPTLLDLKDKTLHHHHSDADPADTMDGAASWLSRNKKMLILGILALVIFDSVGLWLYSFLNAPIAVTPKVIFEEDAAASFGEGVREHIDKNAWKEGKYRKLSEADLRSAKEPKLHLENWDATDADLLKVRDPRSFKEVVLKKTKVTSLANLPLFNGVRKLDVSYTDISDQSLKNIVSLHRLSDLDLGHTRISDAGLKHVMGQKHMSWLNLDSTNVTIKGLPGLASLTNLRKLILMKGGYSISDIESFAGGLAPYCTIVLSGGFSDEELQGLARKFPDLVFNDHRGSMFSDEELAEGLLKPPSNYAKSAQLFKNLIAQSKQNFGTNSTRARRLYLGLGKALFGLEQWNQASENLKMALLLSGQAGDKYAEAMAADFLLQVALKSKPDVHGLKDLLSRAIASSDEWYGAHSGEAMVQRLNLARRSMGKTSNDVALPFFEKALAIEKSKTNPDTRIIAGIQADLGDCYYWLHQPDRAKKSYASAAKLFDKVNGTLTESEFVMHVTCYRAPAELAIGEGKFLVARQLNDEAVKRCSMRNKTMETPLMRFSIQEIMAQKQRIQKAILKG